MLNNIIPGHIGSNSIQCGHFGFVGGKHESSMFEGDNISRLWIPSLCKLCCSCWGNKSNPIRSVIIIIIFGKYQEKYQDEHVQFTFPAWGIYTTNNFRFSVSIFLSKGRLAPKGILIISKAHTLCLRNPLDRPVSKGVEGSRKMIPSPPWSMISWNIFSRWSVPSHTVYGATLIKRRSLSPPSASSFYNSDIRKGQERREGENGT